MKSLPFALMLVFVAGCTSTPSHTNTTQTVYPTVSIRGPACDGHTAPQLEVRGDAAFAKSLVGTNLVCQIGNLYSEAKLGEFAKARCMNSDTYLMLKSFAQNRMVGAVTASADGSVTFQTDSVSNLTLDPGAFSSNSNTQEQINCVKEQLFTGDRAKVLKIAEYECQRKVYGEIRSKFIRGFFADKALKDKYGGISDMKFDLSQMDNGNFQASNLQINDLALPGVGSAKVDVSKNPCEVIQVTASVR